MHGFVPWYVTKPHWLQLCKTQDCHITYSKRLQKWMQVDENASSWFSIWVGNSKQKARKAQNKTHNEEQLEKKKKPTCVSHGKEINGAE